jgi:uncharacterized protein
MLPLIVLLLLLLGLMLWPAWWVRRVIARYSQPPDRYPHTGAEIARRLLSRLGLRDVGVELTDAGDHYDPITRTVRLSEAHFHGRSLAAVTIAAHEVGHAVQDFMAYPPLRWRGRLVHAANAAQRAAPTLLLLAPVLVLLTRSPLPGLLALVLALGSMLLMVVVHLVTLPTEFDASFGRALPLLHREAVLIPGDERHARRLLKAAALTYVSAAALSLLSLARWLPLLRR